MAFDPAKLWQFLRESLGAPKVWLFVLLIALPSLLLPQAAVELLGVDGLREQFRPWLGVASLVATAALILEGGSATLAWWRKRKAGERLRMELRDLSATEKAALKPYLEERTKTQYFVLADGVANGLEARKILFRAASMGDMISGFAFNLQPWVWDELNKHPELLDLTPEDMRALGETPIDEDGMPIPQRRRNQRI